MTTRLAVPATYAALILLGGVILLFWPTFASMVDIWNRDETFTHGYIIPLLSLWLLWRDRNRLAAQPIAAEYRVLWLIAGLSAVWLVADVIEVQVVKQTAATALIPASLWAALGNQWARRALFPLCYLFFAVPFGDFLVPGLVRFTTETTVGAVQLIGIPIYRDGSAFMLPSGNFEVVKACSGVRYLIATIALGTLFAALTYKSWRRRLWFMALCLVLPIVANSIRAFGIVLIAHYSEMKYAAGFDHLIYGWVFFGFVILLLFWIGGKFADNDETNEATLQAHQAPVPALSLVALLSVLAIAPLTSYAIQAGVESSHAADTAIELIPGRGEWQGPTPSTVEWRPFFLNDGQVAAGRYKAANGDAKVFVRRYAWQAEGSNEATAAQLIPNAELGWRVDAETQMEVGGHIVYVAEVFGRNGERWRTWRWYLINNDEARGAVNAKWLQLKSWLRGEPPAAAVVCIAVSMLDPRFDSPAAADAALTKFAKDFDWRWWAL